MNTHKDLTAWQKSMDLVTELYKITKTFPSDEMYGLTSQIRRSAVSIPSNIAEGAGRRYKREYVRFLHISLGSLSELETQITIAFNLEYISKETYKKIDNQITEIIRMLVSLIAKFKETL